MTALFGGSPIAHRAVVFHVARFAQMASDATVSRGREFWPSAHDLATEGGRDLGVGTRQASGIMAAVSPGMEYETQNVHALAQIGNLEPKDWAMVEASRHQPHTGRGHPGRLPETGAMLREKAPALSRAVDEQLLKAHRMLGGEDPEEVITRQTNPKTNSMFHNLYSPGDAPHVTIDGRIYDIITNRMRGWQEGRGIGSAALPSGKTTHYEEAEQVMRDVTAALGKADPRYRDAPTDAVQAATWFHGKEIETQGLTKRGKPRQQGPTRRGQAYVS